jgi:signal transduction histidine kinase
LRQSAIRWYTCCGIPSITASRNGSASQRGKPAKGTINMSAYQAGNDIIIEVADDGAGIDPEKIAARRLKRNDFRGSGAQSAEA